MDQYSEVEAKFAAEEVTVAQLKAFVEKIDKHPVLGPRGYTLGVYKKADGQDNFWKIGEGVLRYRFDELRKIEVYDVQNRHANQGLPNLAGEDVVPTHKYTMFTGKERRSGANLLNRKEVDIKLDQSVGPAAIDAFMELMRAQREYKILKDYEIWYLESKKLGVEICFAMYDVMRPDGSDKRRFVEVEIERESTCSAKEGRAELQGLYMGL